MTKDELLDLAAQAVASADALLIGAGAGMGVDSGLPDFRGTEGFWKAYPPYQKLRLDFPSLANPKWFAQDPTLAWGFYGHRLNLYRQALPHDGFAILLSWAKKLKHGAFVFTSNVDGHFQKAGFDPDRVFEVHGSLLHMQCSRRCGAGIFSPENYQIEIDEANMRAGEPLPACPGCGELARPNVLMFGDWDWDDRRSQPQQRRFEEWLQTVGNDRLVIIECGAGMAIPTIRHGCEQLADACNATLIRINVREPEVPKRHLGLSMGALEALQAIKNRRA